MIGFPLEVEQGDELGRAGHRVRNHAFAVDPEEAATVTRVASFQHQLFVAQVQKMVELLGVAQSNDQVFASERLLAKMAVGVFQVDLVQQLALGLRDVVASDTVACINLRR